MGSVKRTGPMETGRTPENIEKVITALQQSPTFSARRHTLTPILSNRSQSRRLDLDLSFHPHKMQVVRQLNANKLNRLHFCRQMQQDQLLLDVLLMSDEANFHVSGLKMIIKE
ncbi:hypothetical protein ANN_07289 [Periplaneta americana]|uniref:Uncharacterized protein n=1 Tax=Periplaneta americana TaxID=6978 RepID=A0ABQ8TFT5_PERAM|nr:hypothetical protein ANN_07289 [Periplaneta americana]